MEAIALQSEAGELAKSRNDANQLYSAGSLKCAIYQAACNPLRALKWQSFKNNCFFYVGICNVQ